MFRLSAAIFRFTRYVSISPFSHTEILASGFIWRCLQHAYFTFCDSLLRIDNVEKMLNDSTSTLINLTSFARAFTEQIFDKSMDTNKHVIPE